MGNYLCICGRLQKFIIIFINMNEFESFVCIFIFDWRVKYYLE